MTPPSRTTWQVAFKSFVASGALSGAGGAVKVGRVSSYLVGKNPILNS